jgi:hypothetical protein
MLKYTADGRFINVEKFTEINSESTPDDELSWIQIGGDIDGENTQDYLGESNTVAMNSDGSIIAVGAKYNDGTSGDNNFNSGHIRVYKRDVNETLGWKQLGDAIEGVSYRNYLGTVAMSSDGSTIAIGATGNYGVHGNNSGHVRIFYWDGSRWSQVGYEIEGENKNDRSGGSIAMNHDGSIIAIGAKDNDDDKVPIPEPEPEPGNKNDRSQVGYEIEDTRYIGPNNYSSSGHVRIYKYREYTSNDVNTYHYASRKQGYNQSKPLIITEAISYSKYAEPVIGESYWTQVGVEINNEE